LIKMNKKVKSESCFIGGGSSFWGKTGEKVRDRYIWRKISRSESFECRKKVDFQQKSEEKLDKT
jgi:hypothetical protein